MNLLHDACGSEVELLEIRLHNLLEGENAGWLLGTRTPALFWQHWRRRGDRALGRSDQAVFSFAMQVHVPCFEQLLDEIKKSFIFDLLA